MLGRARAGMEMGWGLAGVESDGHVLGRVRPELGERKEVGAGC